MYIKINNMVFENAEWNVFEGNGDLTFESDEPLSNLEQLFDPENAVEIERYNDNDELIEKWYNKSLKELSYKKIDNKWMIQAKFGVSAIDDGSESEIRKSIDDTDDGLLEIAGLVSDLEDKADDLEEAFTSQKRTLDRLSSLYDDLADRVARLENAQ